MTEQEFCELPMSAALRVLLHVSPGLAAKLATVEAPRIPGTPKYDLPIYRKGGIQWASETDLAGLIYWRDRNLEGSRDGGEYAEKNAKTAKQLAYWIEWRECFRDARWRGIRNDRQTTADAPSDRPEVYEREQRAAAVRREHAEPKFADDNASAEPDNDDIPF